MHFAAKTTTKNIPSNIISFKTLAKMEYLFLFGLPIGHFGWILNGMWAGTLTIKTCQVMKSNTSLITRTIESINN